MLLPGYTEGFRRSSFHISCPALYNTLTRPQALVTLYWILHFYWMVLYRGPETYIQTYLLKKCRGHSITITTHLSKPGMTLFKTYLVLIYSTILHVWAFKNIHNNFISSQKWFKASSHESVWNLVKFISNQCSSYSTFDWNTVQCFVAKGWSRDTGYLRNWEIYQKNIKACSNVLEVCQYKFT